MTWKRPSVPTLGQISQSPISNIFYPYLPLIFANLFPYNSHTLTLFRKQGRQLLPIRFIRIWIKEIMIEFPNHIIWVLDKYRGHMTWFCPFCPITFGTKLFRNKQTLTLHMLGENIYNVLWFLRIYVQYFWKFYSKIPKFLHKLA